MAVVRQLELEQVVLIGHSAGGAVIVEAARYLATAVRGVVGVDAHVADGRTHPDPSSSGNVARAFSEQFRGGDPHLGAEHVCAHVRSPTGGAHGRGDVGRSSPHRDRVAGSPLGAGSESAGRARKSPRARSPSTPVIARRIGRQRRYGIEVMLMGGHQPLCMLENAPPLTPCSPKRYNTVCLRAPRRGTETPFMSLSIQPAQSCRTWLT